MAAKTMLVAAILLHTASCPEGGTCLVVCQMTSWITKSNYPASQTCQAVPSTVHGFIESAKPHQTNILFGQYHSSCRKLVYFAEFHLVTFVWLSATLQFFVADLFFSWQTGFLITYSTGPPLGLGWPALNGIGPSMCPCHLFSGIVGKMNKWQY